MNNFCVTLRVQIIQKAYKQFTVNFLYLPQFSNITVVKVDINVILKYTKETLA